MALKHLMIGAVDLVLVSSLIGCAPVPFEFREIKTAPSTQEQAGHLVYGASLDEIRTQLEGRDFHRRELNSKHHLYEIYDLSKEEIVSALPHAKVESNQSHTEFPVVAYTSPSYPLTALDPFSTPQINLGPYSGVLTSSDSEEKIAVPTSFSECENTPQSQRPKTAMVPLNQDLIKFSPHGPVFTMKHSSTKPVRSVLKIKSVSRRGPNTDIFDLKIRWYYKPPKGSSVEPVVAWGRRFDAVVDTVGEHILAIRVEDASGACAMSAVILLSTANVPYQAPRFNREDLRHNFDLKALTAYLDQIQGRESWKYSKGEGVTIAFIDSGLNYNHPLVAHNVKVNKGEIPENGLDDDRNGKVDDYVGFDFFHNDAYPFDDRGHGSRATGLGASAIGLAQKAQVLPVKVSAFGKFDIGELIEGIFYAVDSGAQIINVSLGTNKYHPRKGEAIKYAKDAGVLIVASVANSSSVSKVYPANFPASNIVSVAASDQNGALASYSNYGVDVADVAAPGGEPSAPLKTLYMYNPEHLFASDFGTSMASPLVAGVAAQILSINPRLKPEEVIEIILSTGDDHPGLKGKVKSGRNLNALNAVMAAQKTLSRQ